MQNKKKNHNEFKILGIESIDTDKFDRQNVLLVGIKTKFLMQPLWLLVLGLQGMKL